MHPVICKIGPITVYSYGLFFALCFATGTIVAAWRAKRSGYDPGDIIDLAIAAFISGIIGGRLFHLFEAPRFYLDHPLSALNVYQGGLVFYGALIGLMVCVIVFCRIRKLPTLTIMDFVAPGIMLGHVWGRIGCFMAGCCHGIPTDSWFGVAFKAAVDDIPRHPTQLYESAGNFVLFFVLLAVEKRWKYFPGFTFACYLLMYGFSRFMLEFIRGDERGEYLFGVLSMSQVISMVGITLAVSFLVYMYRKRREAPVV
ncbi:MAG: prolipoprotein diacylglyceryl transferase [bacterium]|jgi:phosphatidylglycerol:prolipoprotein diacylglycerol transferase|nr:prolipoprotein diacylglyceryl transferase [bacterium]